MKLISRYNRFNLPALVLIFLISSLFSYMMIKQVLLKELDENITHAKKEIKNYVNKEQKIPEIIPLSKLAIEFRKINVPLTDTVFHTINPVIPNQKKQHLFRKLVFQVSAGVQQYAVSISSPLEGTSYLISIILFITVTAIFFIIIISLLISRYILSKLWLPFYESLKLLHDFRIDKPTPLPFPETQTDEFKFMIENLRAATSKEADTYQSLKEFTENASHEIQTPLAIIRSKLDILIQKEAFSEYESETSRSAYRAIDKLSKLSKSLLLITKIENQKFEEKISVNLHKKLRDKLTEFQELWDINNIGIVNQLYSAEIMANEDLIDILLYNLLSNATKHNIKNGIIEIYLNQGSLSVINTGIENSIDHQRIFKRFYKESQHSDSNGLGLTIAKQICDVSEIKIIYSYFESRHSFILKW